MDVISDTGSVGSRVVGTEDLEAFLSEFTGGHLREKGEKISRLSSRVLSNLSARMSTGGVEVSQSDGSPVVGLRVADVLDDQFRHHLCSTVTRFRREGRRFGDGNDLRSSVDGGGGRVDHTVAFELLHHLIRPT